MRTYPSCRALIVAVALVATAAGTAFAQRPPRRGPMGPMGEGDFAQTLTNWFIQASAKVAEGGEKVSAPGLAMNRWYPATVPATVMGTLVQNNVYPDIYVGDNLKKDHFRPVPGPLVVPDRVPSQRGPVEDDVQARVRRNQLPGQYLAQRQEGRRRLRGLRRLPPPRVRRDGGGREGRTERPRRRDLPAPARGADRGLRGLEPVASGQEHGALAGGAGQGDGRRLHRRPVRRDQARPRGLQRGHAHGLGRAQEQHREQGLRHPGRPAGIADVLAGSDPGAEGDEEGRLRAGDDPRARPEEPEGLVDPRPREPPSSTSSAWPSSRRAGPRSTPRPRSRSSP